MQPEGAPDAAGISRELVAQYFSGAYTGDRTRSRQWRLLVTGIRIAVLAAAIVLLALTALDLWRHAALLGWPLPATIARTPIWIGLILLAAAVVPQLWRLDWALAALFVMLAAAAETFVVQSADRRAMLLLVSLGAAALAAGLYLRLTGRRELPGLPELEPQLDAWTDGLMGRLVTDSVLPPGPLAAGDCRYILRTFPRTEPGRQTTLLCRIGHDRRPRITPLGVAAFAFRPETLVVVEGAVDLVSGQQLYRRTHEVRYEDVAALQWSSDVVPESDEKRAPGAAKALQAAGAVRARPETARRKDSLELRLGNGAALSLVFRDTGALPGNRPGPVERETVEDIARIRSLWRDILARGKA